VTTNAVVKVNDESGSGSPLASITCETVTVYRLPDSRSSAGNGLAYRAPASPRNLTLAGCQGIVTPTLIRRV